MTDHGHHRGRNNLHRKTVIIMRNTTSTISRRRGHRSRSTATMKALLGVGLVAGLLTGCSDAGDDVTEHSANAAATESSSDDDGDSREVLLAKAEFSQKTFTDPSTVLTMNFGGPTNHEEAGVPLTDKSYDYTVSQPRLEAPSDENYARVCWDITGHNLLPDGVFRRYTDYTPWVDESTVEGRALAWVSSDQGKPFDTDVKSIHDDSYIMEDHTGKAYFDNLTKPASHGNEFTATRCANFANNELPTEGDGFTGIVLDIRGSDGKPSVQTNGWKLDFSY